MSVPGTRESVNTPAPVTNGPLLLEALARLGVTCGSIATGVSLTDRVDVCAFAPTGIKYESREMKAAISDVEAVSVPPGPIQTCGLRQVDFSDGYRGHVAVPGLTALECARAIFENPPRFAVALMSMRNRIVALFGLKTPEKLHHHQPGDRLVGNFPLISESLEQVVLGGDDKHLDFRILVSALGDRAGSEVTLSTLVRTNNLFGKIYLFAVMPFHRFLSRHMLARGLRRIAETRRADGVLKSPTKGS